MAYCEERGIPHSHLLGGPLQWTQEDRAKLLAVRLEKASRCTKCGTSPWEWEANPYAYEPTIINCPGCTHLEVANDGEKLPPGSSRQLIPTRVAARMRRLAQLRPSTVAARRKARLGE